MAKKAKPPAKKAAKSAKKKVAKRLIGGIAHIDTRVPPHVDVHAHIDTPRGPHIDTGGNHIDAHQDVFGIGPHEDFALPHVDAAIPPHVDSSPHADVPAGPHVDQTVRPPFIKKS
jgi:hypothetical protein